MLSKLFLCFLFLVLFCVAQANIGMESIHNPTSENNLVKEEPPNTPTFHLYKYIQNVTRTFLESTGVPRELLGFPQNVSALYKGNWEIHSGNQSLASLWKFRKISGHILFQFSNKTSYLPHITTILGEMVVRDGIYITNPNKRFLVQGMYFLNTGDIFLLANPLQNDSVRELAFELTKNSSIQDVIAQSETLFTKALMDQTKNLECFFRILLNVKPSTKQTTAQTENDQISQRPKIEIKGVVESPNCQLVFFVETQTIPHEANHAKATNYVVMAIAIYFCQIILLIRQMEFSSTQSATAKVSILTIGIQAICDAYLCFFHLTAGIVFESAFNGFATAAFFTFITFSMFEMRYLLLIWKSMRPVTFHDGAASMRRELSLLYARFYAFVMTSCLLLYYIPDFFVPFVFFLFSFWVPQIISNATLDTRRAMLRRYVFGTSFLRLLIPLYFLGCPVNILHTEPNQFAGKVLVAYVCLQVAILAAQERFGPRFFVPKRFLPQKYDYFRALPANLMSEDLECVICMSGIDKQRDYMLTPCNHIFHANCLSQWIGVKLECPTCRRQVPYA